MSYEPPPRFEPTQGKNRAGLIGFIISLAGLLTCGFLCPVGVVFSCVGMMKPPRGFAVAGIVIGVVGSIIPVIIVLIYGWAFFTFMSCITGGFKIFPSLTVAGEVESAVQEVQRYRVAHGGVTPGDVEGNNLIRTREDFWMHPLRYKAEAGGDFEVRSAGQDGVMDTGDDVVRLGSEVAPSTEPWVEPATTSMPATGP